MATDLNWFYIQRWAERRAEREALEKRMNKNEPQTSNSPHKEKKEKQ